jgi:hypothetical protein
MGKEDFGSDYAEVLLLVGLYNEALSEFDYIDRTWLAYILTDLSLLTNYDADGDLISLAYRLTSTEQQLQLLSLIKDNDL